MDMYRHFAKEIEVANIHNFKNYLTLLVIE